MSYTRRYSETVTGTYSRRVSISYPASQSGGTVSETVSGTVEVPVNINIHVDTNNFDHSVNNCRGAVTGLNAMVVATSLEEVKSKQRTSHKIGQSIVGGFFNYISSELSQQSQELRAKCESLIIALSEQKTACIDKSAQMGADYKRIAGRYGKLFTDLDNELSSRIRTLDKPVFKINTDLMECTSRTTDTALLGTATISAAESSRLESILSATMIKHRAVELVGKANEFLKNTYILKHSLSNMLSDNQQCGDILLPVMYIEAGEEAHSIKRQVYGTTSDALRRVNGIDVEVERQFQSSNLNWKSIKNDHQDEIDTYFNNEIEKNKIDQRVAKMMLTLKGHTTLKVL